MKQKQTASQDEKHTKKRNIDAKKEAKEGCSRHEKSSIINERSSSMMIIACTMPKNYQANNYHSKIYDIKQGNYVYV